MEKQLFSLLKKMVTPTYIGYMLLSFIPLVAVPLVQYFFNPNPWIIWGLAALFFPVVFYFFITAILFMIYAYQIARNQHYLWAALNQNISVFSVKQIARTLNISPRLLFLC